MKTFQVIQTTSQAAYCGETGREIRREESEMPTRLDKPLLENLKCIFVSCIWTGWDGEKDRGRLHFWCRWDAKKQKQRQIVQQITWIKPDRKRKWIGVLCVCVCASYKKARMILQALIQLSVSFINWIFLLNLVCLLEGLLIGLIQCGNVKGSFALIC